uniref:Uncharacterized protein n=1 Tax=Utricularia reniformis TaxID=192314 RepID=A0A1Y0B1H7_9LAMI|nr:hypothetical protein AEK19_MT1012 [Utricularia reniformis]ART31234.1 hypothetical protein AEK19_MT1012 [Utricularia reniformis]
MIWGALSYTVRTLRGNAHSIQNNPYPTAEKRARPSVSVY